MTGLMRHRAEMVWAALLLAVPAAALWGPRGSAAETDTWSVGPQGKKVFFTLVERTWPDVARQAERLDPSANVGTLCLLGPARRPDAAQWRKLHEWVSAGHVLVFAARSEDLAGDLGPFGLSVRPHDAPAAAEAGPGALQVDEGLSGPGPKIAWRRSAWIEGAGPDAWVAARFQGRPVIVAQDVGRGMVVAIASDEIFENVSLLDPGRALLPFRLLERVRGHGGVAFDESLNGAGPPRVVGLLLGRPLRPLTFQLLALALVFGWMGARRFGPRVTGDPAARRFMVEHATALGHLCHEAGAGPGLVASYLEYFRRELGLRHDARGGAVESERVSRAAGTDGTTVAAVLASATRLVAQGRGSHRETAEVVAGLARIKHRIKHSV